MTQTDFSAAKNPKLRGSLAAIRRAAEMARRTAIETETGIVVVERGRRIHISAEELRQRTA